MSHAGRWDSNKPGEVQRIADITNVDDLVGFAYAAFVIEVFSRRILGWRVSNTLRSGLASDALDMVMWTRQNECRQSTTPRRGPSDHAR